MVDFGNTQMEGTITPEVQRQEAVVDQSGAVFAEAMQLPAKQIGGIIGGIFKANADAQSNSVLVDFRQKMVNISQAVEQGLSISESRTRQRALYSEVLANNPSLAEDIDKLYGNLVNSSGIAHLAVQGNEIEQGRMKAMEAAATNGWITDYNDPEKGLNDYMRSQAAANQYTLTQNVNNLTVQQRKIAQTQSLYQMADTSLPWVQNKIDLALRQIKDGADPAKVYETLKSDYAQARAQINWQAGEENADWVTKPLDVMIEDFGKVVNGEYTTEAYNARVNGQIALGKSAWMADPEVAQILIAQEVLGENFPTLMSQLLPRAQTKLAQFLTPYDATSDTNTRAPDLMDTSPETQQAIDVLKSKIEVINKGGATEDGVREVSDMYTNALRSFKDYGSAVDRPQELRQLMDFLANEETNKFAVANGGVPTNISEAAKNLIQAQYAGPLLQAVRTRWDGLELNIPGAGVTADNPYGSVNPDDSIDIVWDGTGVRFMAKEGFEDNIIVRSTVESLNTGDNSVAQPLNTLIRASATVNGSNDYKSVWENELKQRVFPDNVTSEEEFVPVVPESDSDINLTDFNEQIKFETTNNQSTFTPPDPNNFVEPKNNPDVDPAVMAKYANRRVPVSIRNNNMGAVSIIGNIENSWAARQPGFVGVTARPANEGGYYAKYATPQHGVAAASKLLENYGKQGVDSPAAIVRKWSASTAAHNVYAKTLVNYLKEAGYEVDATTRLDLSDPNIRLAILKAKSSHESGAGRPVYSDAVFKAGVTGNF